MEKELTIGQQAKIHVCTFQAENKAREILVKKHIAEYMKIFDKELKRELKEWDSHKN